MTDNTGYNDEFLLQNLKKGDEPSFNLIFQRYWKELYYDALKMLGDESLADDCVQEVFISLWQRRAEVEITYLKAYLKKAVRFQVLWLIRDDKISAKCYERISKSVSATILHDPCLMKELDHIFQEIVQELPPDVKEIFLMVRNEGLPYKVVAERMGVSVKTIERKMASSVKHFRFRLGDLLHSLLFL